MMSLDQLLSHADSPWFVLALILAVLGLSAVIILAIAIITWWRDRLDSSDAGEADYAGFDDVTEKPDERARRHQI